MNEMNDLISRAAAIEAFDDERVDRNYGDVSPESVIEVIKSIPAVDAVSVRHGRWQGVSPFVNSEECSNCRYCIPSKELETPYCPWCGGRMDLEE